MKKEDFDQLTEEQQSALLVAMHVRNEMEEFHHKYLTDEQMAELNPIIRQALIDAFVAGFTPLERAWLSLQVPDYWEIPEPKKLTLSDPN